ncbi:MAG: MBOAT family O-acyltransferase [Desulfovibrio sp.]
MVFSSIIFVFFFLPFVLFGHSLLFQLAERRRGFTWLMNLFLFTSSILFYAWGEPQYVLILLGCAWFTFHVGLIVERNGNNFWLTIGILGNLGLLMYYKYAMLFLVPHIQTVNGFLPQYFNIAETLQIALPLGISFYVFQAISYLIDVSRKDVNASRDFINFSCYLTMFPQLVAGPIVRYSQVGKELVKRSLTLNSCSDGVARFIIGLGKKVLIADTLGKVADAAFQVPNGELSLYGAWVGIICYTLQIYYDFSGYSDMAIGIGRMLGFTFPENFNYPYVARSIQNFWQRWHMSLSTWFRDYLYFPLGGNRKGNYRTYFNLFVVFALCGFWHGANWTFIAWGAYYGVFLVLERIFPNSIKALPRPVQHLYVMLIVVLGWVLFKADSFTHAMYYYQAMLGSFEEGLAMNSVWLLWYGHDTTIAMVLAVIFACPVFPRVRELYHTRVHSTVQRGCLSLGYCAGLLAMLLVTLMPLFGASYNAFIYFRF